MSLPQKAPDLSSHEESWSVVENPASTPLLSDEAYFTYGQTLSAYCGNSIDENRWMIPFADGIRRASVTFENLPVTNEELRLVKTYIVDTLSHYSSPATCTSKIKSLGFLFLFLQEKGFQVTMLSTPIINLFRIWLDEIDFLTVVRKNTIESDLFGFIAFLRERELLRPAPIMPLRPRPTPPSNIRRAPDQYTMSLLDAYFSDFSNTVPTAYRCLYLLLRMIPSRDHEALSMMIDGLTVSEDLMEISFPTHKETANHRGIEVKHHRYADQYPENLLLRSLQKQREYAQRCQSDIEEDRFRGRLMVSPRNPKRLVTADEFNAFLEEVCEEQGITDAYGNPTKITMYSLRHANGAEMAASNGFSREEFTRAFAHNSHYSDDSYSYASKHDELCATAPHTEAVRSALTSSTVEDSPAQLVSPVRMRRMQSDLQTQLVGVSSVCQEKGCVPQFQHCVSCESFRPDPQYLAEAEQCCALLQERIERCRITGDSEAIQFNERQLAAYTMFIQRATTL